MKRGVVTTVIAIVGLLVLGYSISKNGDERRSSAQLLGGQGSAANACGKNVLRCECRFIETTPIPGILEIRNLDGLKLKVYLENRSTSVHTFVDFGKYCMINVTLTSNDGGTVVLTDIGVEVDKVFRDRIQRTSSFPLRVNPFESIEYAEVNLRDLFHIRSGVYSVQVKFRELIYNQEPSDSEPEIRVSVSEKVKFRLGRM